MSSNSKIILITGGAGFIGSAVIRHIINNSEHIVINVDKLTYAGNLESLALVKSNPRYIFEQVDICNATEIRRVFNEHQPDIVMHLAAESHVDRSIHGPGEFIQTNIVGTFHLLEAARDRWMQLEDTEKANFRFLHVSTDEVYGTLTASDAPFTEQNRYEPNSPYSASKAASDHLVRAWHHTYGLPVLATNCSNNYGPYHFPEKLIPLCILKALQGQDLPIYGDGQQIRDWLYVVDHCKGIATVLEKGAIGETYNIGGWNEKANLEVVHTLCDLLDELTPREDGKSYRDQITFVKDRPGHDRRYAIDATKISNELGWKPEETFETGICKTVQWYLDNQDWVVNVQSGEYKNRLNKNYS